MVLLLSSVVPLCVILAILVKRARARQAADDVIYLGYDDQDNVSSMRSAMLDKIRRGDLDTVD
jgi:hypothetical protein